jgi:hypothetical protein
MKTDKTAHAKRQAPKLIKEWSSNTRGMVCKVSGHNGIESWNKSSLICRPRLSQKNIQTEKKVENEKEIQGGGWKSPSKPVGLFGITA